MKMRVGAAIVGVGVAALGLAACGSGAPKSTSTTSAAAVTTTSTTSSTSTPTPTTTAAKAKKPRPAKKAASKKETGTATTTTTTTTSSTTTTTSSTTARSTTTTHRTTTTRTVAAIAPLPGPVVSGSSGQMRATLHALNHTPTIGVKWEYMVEATNGADQPLTGVVATQFLFGGSVVGHESPPTHKLKDGRLTDRVTFTPPSDGIHLTFEVVVTTRLGKVALDWPVVPKKA